MRHYGPEQHDLMRIAFDCHKKLVRWLVARFFVTYSRLKNVNFLQKYNVCSHPQNVAQFLRL